MKQFLYALTFIASVGTIGVVATHPQLLQQGASMIGVSPSASGDRSSVTEDDHLEKFLSQYPYASKENHENVKPKAPPVPMVASTTPPPKPELPKAPEHKPEPPKAPEPKPETPKAPEPKPEPPKTPEPKPELPPLPSIVAYAPPDPAPIPSPTPAPAPIEPVAPAAVADPFSTETAPPLAPLEPAPPIMSEPAGIASTHPPVSPLQPTPPPPPSPLEPEPEPKAGFASTTGNSIYDPGNLDGWSDPPPIAEKPVVPPPVIQQPVAPPAVPPTTDPFLTARTEPAPISPAPDAVDPFLQASPPMQNPEPAPPPMVSPPMPMAPPQQVPPMTAAAPPMVPPLPTPPATKVGSEFKVSPAIVAEEVPCHGTEIVARVGSEVIMMCDVLPQLRRAGIRLIKENLKKMSPEERRQIPQRELDQFIDGFVEAQYPGFLQEQVMLALVYNDFKVSKSREERDMLEKKFIEEFDQKEIAEMIKEFEVRDIAELRQFLKDQLGSSLERERLLWIKDLIARQWIMFSVQTATGECGPEEMMEYYTTNKSMFTSKTRAQWQELFVAFSNHKSEQEAHTKIAWMGNQIAAGYPLEEIAKRNSEGFTADKGGLWDWTHPGSLSSKELEDAVFTQEVGVLSPKIIRTEKGFHLIRVVKREEAKTKPFVEAQVMIRERIRQQRSMKYREEYFEELNRRYPTIVFKEKIDFDLNRRTAGVFEERK